MKIFAFSDWRVQSLERLAELIDGHKPDAILYAGDDLDRFIPEVSDIVLKTRNHLIPLTYPACKPSPTAAKVPLSKKAAKLLPKLELEFNNVLNKLEIPFHLVNGNDDCCIRINDSYYTRLSEGRYRFGINEYKLKEDSRGNITLSETSWFSQEFAEDSEDLDMLDDEMIDIDDILPTDSGIYVEILPSFGEFTLTCGKEKLSVLGLECHYGMQNRIVESPKGYADIYLSHLPPIGCLDLSSRYGTEHIGSKKLLAAIKKYRPRLVICGHSHIWGGKTAKIGDTTVVNVSSHDSTGSAGNYALIDTSHWSIDMMADEPSKIHSLPGIRTIKRNSSHLRNTKKLKGLYTGNKSDLLKSLDYVDKFGINTERVRGRLKSLGWRKPRIVRPITLDPYDTAFVDIETGLAQGDTPGGLWLVGIWFDGDLRHFVFPKQKRAFLEYIRDNDITSLASWTGYDSKALRPIFKKAKIDIDFADACQRTRNCVIWHTYSLHDLHNAFFPSGHSEKYIDGKVAGLYADHLIIPNEFCPYCPSPEEAMEMIKERNRVDVLQMIEICTMLWEV